MKKYLLLFFTLFAQLQITAQTYNLGINPSPACGGCVTLCNAAAYCTPAGTTPTGNCVAPGLTVSTPTVAVPANSNVRIQVTTRACDASVDGLDGGDFCYVNGTTVVIGAGNTRVNYDQCFFTGASPSTASVGLTANRRDETVQVIFTVTAGAGTGCTALPAVLRINLSSFAAQTQTNGTVKLYWTTESEQDNNFTAIEKSFDGYSFTEIGKVYSTGNSTSQKGYDFTDNTVNVNNVYYRLKAVDNTGAATYSKVVLVVGTKNKEVLYIYPNPSSSFVQISSATLIKQVILVNAEGKMVLNKTLQNINNYQLPLNGIAKGVYVVKVITEKNILTNKIIVSN
jgi:Secretion system C-terminal sorting domain